MKYGAGSALLSEAIARSSSCCNVLSRTGSAAPGAGVSPGSIGAANNQRKRQKNTDFNDDIATVECTSSVRHRKCYLGAGGASIRHSPQRTQTTRSIEH